MVPFACLNAMFAISIVGATKRYSAPGLLFTMIAVNMTAPPLVLLELPLGISSRHSEMCRLFVAGSYDPNNADTIGRNHAPHASPIVGVPITSGNLRRLKHRSAIAASFSNSGRSGTRERPDMIRSSQSRQLVSHDAVSIIASGFHSNPWPRTRPLQPSL